MPKAKSTIPYYGAKSSLANLILPLIPKDIDSFIEPFAGGASIFFNLKNKPKFTVLNDTNDLVVNFYNVVKSKKFKELQNKIRVTPFSRRLHKKTTLILKFPVLYDKLSLAWAFYVNLVVSFSNVLGGGFATDKYGKKLYSFNRKKLLFSDDIRSKLDDTIIESLDASECIKKYDQPNAYFFCDPPYVTDDPNLSIDRGHYKSYTLEDFEKLLETLSKIKGRFLMTSYQSELLKRYSNKYGFYSKEYKRPITASNSKKGIKRRMKIEVFTANYPI